MLDVQLQANKKSPRTGEMLYKKEGAIGDIAPE
jgi:hypothetical protein